MPCMDTPPPSGRLAWRSVARLAGDTEAVATSACAVADLLPGVLAAIESEEAQATPLAARASAALELATAAARLRHAAMRLQVAAAGLVEREAVHRTDGERTPRTWLARHGGMSHGEASALCRAAETCERFPGLAGAFRSGEITAGHVDAAARIIPARFTGERRATAVEQVREVESIIVDAARQADVGEFADLCGRIRDRLDTDGPADRAAEPSRVWLHRMFDGRWALSGDLSADDGAVLATILADLASRRAAAAAGGADSGDHTDDHNASEPEPADVHPDSAEAAATRAEWQARDLIGVALAGAGSGRVGRVGLYLHIDLADLDPPSDADGAGLDDLLAGRRPAHTEAGLDISDDTLWGLMADADVTPVFRRDGRSLSYGRTRRLAPPILRRVIAHRDRRCRFPGCDRPAVWTQIHHVDHWEEGGGTDPSSCCGLCGTHHREHHRGRFGVVGDAEGDLRFTDGTGAPLDPRPRYRRPPDGVSGDGGSSAPPDESPGTERIAS